MAMAKVAACVARRRGHPAGGGLTCYSACDINVVCQDVLKNHPPDSAAEHCFGDLCARPPSDVVRQLRARLLHYQKKPVLRRPAHPLTEPRGHKRYRLLAGRGWPKP